MSFTTFLNHVRTEFGAITQPVYCSGTIPLESAMSSLFYGKNGKAELINFANATDKQLSLLADACQEATFGLNNRDVLDESYRKAGKMDASEFSTQFSPWASGVIKTVKEKIFLPQGGDNESLHVELYKLNVYGPGSFFKAHVDTPRNENMVGSLVIVLPTVHEGGSLIIRHGGEDHVIDTAQAVNSEPTPHAAFVAFYSDVEHEVALVTSGYRVTLTYNISVADSAADKVTHALDTYRPINNLQNSLNALLNDPTFLPKGGFLGFGLSHQYPFKQSSGKSLSKIINILKGSDAEVKQVCEALDLHVVLKALYAENPSPRHPCCLVDRLISFEGDLAIEVEDSSDFLEHVAQEHRGTKIVYPYDLDREEVDAWVAKKGKPIVWIKPFAKCNRFKSPYLAYGNEAHLAHAYGNVCLVAAIGKASERIV